MSDIIRDLQLPRCPRPHPGLPLAPARPHPFVLPPPCARAAGALTRPAPALQQAGSHSGPRGLRQPSTQRAPPAPATDWPAPTLQPLTCPLAGRHPGDGALPASRRTPWSPGPSAAPWGFFPGRRLTPSARLPPFPPAPPPPRGPPQALHP